METPKFPSVRYTHFRPTGFDSKSEEVTEWVTIRSFVTNDKDFALRVFHRDLAVHGQDICQTREDVMSAWGPER